MNKIATISAFMLALGLLASCGGESPTQITNPTIDPTETPTLVPTEIPTITPTETPTIKNEFKLSLKTFDIASNGSNVVGFATIDDTTKEEGDFKLGEKITVIAKRDETLKEPTHFFGWFDENDNLLSEKESYSFEMPNNDVTLIAKFNTERTVTLGVYNNQNERGTVIGSGKYAQGKEIKIEAKNNEGYLFSSWVDSDNNVFEALNVSSLTITLGTVDLTLNAYFKEIPVKNHVIEYGNYPQTKVNDEALNSELNKLIGDVPTETDSKSWISYKYYQGVSKPGSKTLIADNSKDYMWYQDVIYKNEKYRAVYFNQYRPTWTNGTGSIDGSLQDNRGYEINNVYFFKYESIKWTVLNDEGLLFSNLILDVQDYYHGMSSHDYNGEKVHDNNYEASNIRYWLNNNFYNLAFENPLKHDISETLVKNDLSSTLDETNKYISNNTNDKVFLLSKEELMSENIGLNLDEKRVSKTTDYANCMGAYINVDSLNGRYWTRSPNKDKSYSAYNIDKDGKINSWNVYGVAHGGVRPAIIVK